MYYNNEYYFGYDMDAVVFSIDEDKAVGFISVREVGEQEENAGFVGGGIASGGQAYILATTDNVDYLKPYKYQIIIDNHSYMLTRKGQHNINMGGKFSYGKSRKETILYLE